MLLKESNKFEMGLPSLIKSARPLPMVILPKVTIKGGTFESSVIKPLIVPIKVPTNKAKKMESPRFPDSASANNAATTPETAKILPNDRSVPPAMIGSNAQYIS